MKKYTPQDIEKKWQDRWEKEGTYKVNLDAAKKPFYNLMMFPYPSAEGLHVGNVYAFTGADIYGRFTRMKGFDVFEPIGLDGFGIHSENYALKVNKNPRKLAKISEENFYRQLHLIGNTFDWDRTVETYDPDYYKWTQWIFIQLFKKGLAYRKKSPVNFCPKDLTVLADEQVINGACERCGTIVEKRDLEQWFFRITDYAQRLLDNLEGLNWSEKVKIAQKNWIGRSEGLMIDFDDIKVFTTRPETADGATFLVLSPEHPYIEEIKKRVDAKKAQEIDDYVTKVKNQKSKVKSNKEKSGVFTGFYVKNPVTNKNIPVWIADYVLMEYGTGAIMAVPVEDERDREFAKAHKIEIAPTSLKVSPKGQKTVNYHLRDWLISRQRYWGPPIPMINCSKCGWQPVLEKDLPVLLPDVSDWKPKGTGKSPLASIESFVNTTCPKCGGSAKRETDVSDTFLDSAWYFFRYTSTEEKKSPWIESRIKKWLPVHMYIGGAEHSVLHLLYSRFVTMVFKDMGLVDFEEPFARFYAHGLLIKEGAKMSKSKGNVIVPDEYIKKYGADTLRTYLMFLGPYNQGGDFYDSGIEGIFKFLNRVYKLLSEVKLEEQKSKNSLQMMHKTVKRVTEDMENLRFNTAIAKLMEWYNFLAKQTSISKEEVLTFLKLLAPFAPHMTEELYSSYSKDSIHLSSWPKFEAELLKEDIATIVVQVNGKFRDSIAVDSSKIADQKLVEGLARKGRARNYIKDIKKIIYVPGKILNFVV
ncbi:MAG TPA: class I tRNA ligase family protein [Patescibacteria group bacterium]|nr:class I tRNA ligase family protein [Patescibacteria group bacterium]